MNWLYVVIPPNKESAAWWNIITWAIFGNDEDGIFGERSGVSGYDGIAPSFWQFVKWTTRNPLHNLFWHVLVWPGGPMLSIPHVLYIGFRPNGVFGAALGRGYGE